MGENLNKYGMKPLTKKNYFVYGLGNFDVNCKGLGWN